jgi:hypothetical protein
MIKENSYTIPSAEISIITNTKGYLCKRFFLENDEIAKESFGKIYEGTIETDKLSLEGLKEKIENLSQNQAMCLGSKKPEFKDISKITTVKNVIPGKTIARSKSYIEFNDKPAFILFDYDDKELSPNELHEKFIEFIPEFKDVGMLLVPSSSAGIYSASDTAPTEIKSGCHIYVMVNRGTNIPKIGALVKHRAWLNGLGYIEIAIHGAMLPRHIFDDAVYSPERLVFDAPPILDDGVMQVKREILLIQGGMVQC